MTGRRRALLIAVGAVIALAVTSLPLAWSTTASDHAGAEASSSRSCGSVNGYGRRLRVRIERGRVSCDVARTRIRAYIVDRRECDPMGGNTCPKRFSRGWTCAAPTSASPVAVHCYRRRTAVSALK